MLEGEKGECAAQDCAVEVLREGHGIRVIEVTTFQQHCEDDCSPVGIFGKPLFFPYGSGGCALPSGRSQQSTVYIESFRRLWPTLTLSSWYQTWSQHDERLVDIQIPDGRHVEWTETLESTEIVEPDGGAGGDVHKSQALRRYLLVGESGPRTIHERLLADSVEDNVTLVPYEGEDDASYAEREAAFEAEQEARGEEPPFEPDPLPEPMPVCEPEESCPAACRK